MDVLQDLGSGLNYQKKGLKAFFVVDTGRCEDKAIIMKRGSCNMEDKVEGMGMSFLMHKMTDEMREKYKCTVRVVDIGQSYKSLMSISGQLPINPFDHKQKRQKGQKGKNRRSFQNRYGIRS